MHIRDVLDDAPGGASVANLATAFGLDPDRAGTAIDVMGQTLADRIERNTLSRGGLADLVDLLGRPNAGRALSEPQNLASPQIADIGNSILEVLLGSKHASRGVAAKAARESGLDVEDLKRMLPALASMLVGALQRKAIPEMEAAVSKAPGLSLERLGGSPLPLPGDAPRGGPAGGGDTGTWDAQLPQPGGSGGGGIGGTVGRSPLPIPGDTIPGVNDGASRFPRLPDVVRRGGRQIELPDDGGADAGTPVELPGGSLDQIIRQILANVLGFKNGGILSWIVNLLLSRWFLGLIGRILRRALPGR